MNCSPSFHSGKSSAEAGAGGREPLRAEPCQQAVGREDGLSDEAVAVGDEQPVGVLAALLEGAAAAA